MQHPFVVLRLAIGFGGIGSVVTVVVASLVGSDGSTRIARYFLPLGLEVHFFSLQTESTLHHCSIRGEVLSYHSPPSGGQAPLESPGLGILGWYAIECIMRQLLELSRILGDSYRPLLQTYELLLLGQL